MEEKMIENVSLRKKNNTEITENENQIKRIKPQKVESEMENAEKEKSRLTRRKERNSKIRKKDL